jgi:hypothetical protein
MPAGWATGAADAFGGIEPVAWLVGVTGRFRLLPVDITGFFITIGRSKGENLDTISTDPDTPLVVALDVEVVVCDVEVGLTFVGELTVTGVGFTLTGAGFDSPTPAQDSSCRPSSVSTEIDKFRRVRCGLIGLFFRELSKSSKSTHR